MPNHVVFISIGSNIGDKLQNCRNAVCAIAEGGVSLPIAQSRFYQTEPVDYCEQDWFVNAAIKIETDCEPVALLGKLQSIEKNLGRKKNVIRFGPRLIDLDILLYDSLIIELPRLTIPHPRMHQRRFVLQPLCDIDPFTVHPVLKKDMWTLLNALGENKQRIIQID